MLRQASSRNQRSKGFKIKHALQICLLVAICIWLLYQVKHSHEKKKAFEERNSKILNIAGENQVEFFKFGRKGLPQIEETGSVNETHNREEENEETQEEEEHDTKQEEIEDEGRGAGDDEIDEEDQERGDEEAENGEESTEEEEKDSHGEEKDGHEDVDLFDNQEHEGGTQEAREENYKRDDASSAVVHDPHVTESETGTGDAGNTDEEHVVDKSDDDSGANGSKHDEDTSTNGSKGDDDTIADGSKGEVVAENLEKKVVESGNVTNGTDDGSREYNNLSAGSGGGSVANASDAVLKANETIQTDSLLSSMTAADNKDMEVDNKDVEVEFSKPDNGSVSNTMTVEYNSQTEQQTNLTTEAESNTQTELQTNSTGASDHQTELQSNSTVVNAAGISTSSDTASLDSSHNQNVTTDDAIQREDAHNSQDVVVEADKSNTTSELGSEEHTTTSSTNETGEAALGESDNSSHGVITEEERDARTDLSTLPDIRNEVKATEYEATE